MNEKLLEVILINIIYLHDHMTFSRNMEQFSIE